jgi:hypothetical protein
MRKRSLCLSLLLLVCLFSEGCCWCGGPPCRPFLFRRWWWGGNGCCESGCGTPCCGASYFGGGCGGGCCDATVTDGYAVPPIAPGAPGTNPTMPNATPLVRARLGANK